MVTSRELKTFMVENYIKNNLPLVLILNLKI